MFKRVLMIFILGISALALRGGKAEAHLAGYVYTPTFRHIASYDCLGHFYQIPSPDQHPAAFQCVAVVQDWQVLCGNARTRSGKFADGKVVTPGAASGPITLVGQDPFTENDQIEEKTKGRADKSIRFGDDGSPLFKAGDEACQAAHKNWTAVDELILSVDVTLKTFDCGENDPNCTTLDPTLQAYQAKLHCTIPPQYSLPDNPPPGNGTPTDYNCTLLEEIHCDKEGGCSP